MPRLLSLSIPGILIGGQSYSLTLPAKLAEELVEVGGLRRLNEHALGAASPVATVQAPPHEA